MAEQVYTYPLDNKHEVFAQDRDKYYKKQVDDFHKNGKTSDAVEIANIFLFNSDGELLVQKRAKNKNHNPGLLDKSLGGHIKFGDTADFTTMVETVEELQTPSIVLRDTLDFEKARKLLKNYRENVAIIKLLTTGFFTLDKIINGESIPIVNRAHIYIGVYDGTTKPADKEASGVLYYTLDDLKESMEKNPEHFTADMLFYINKFERDFRDFVEHIKD